MSFTIFDWFGLAVILGCVAWCIPGGIVRPGAALGGALVADLGVMPFLWAGVAAILKWFSPDLPTENLGLFQLVLLVVVAGSGTLVGWRLGKPLATIVHFVPGLNLLNLLAGLVIGIGSGLLLLAVLFNVVVALAPEQFINEGLASSWFVTNLIIPLSKLSWWLYFA